VRACGSDYERIKPFVGQAWIEESEYSAKSRGCNTCSCW
jgi:hypothetical protein